MEEKILYMSFKDVDGKTKTIKVNDPREDITAPELKEAMETIKTKNIFGWKIASLEGAKLVTKTVEEMDVANE